MDRDDDTDTECDTRSPALRPESERSAFTRAGDRAPDAVQGADETSRHYLSSRSIRSFVVRNGRMTDAQTIALDTLLPRYGVAFKRVALDIPTLFGRSAPVWVEIGFGNGDALVHMARLRPDIDFLGIEVHAPGVGHALRTIDAHGLTNIRVIQHDALDVLEYMLAPGTIDLVALFFPDPWHKKRHHKRRIVQQAFIEQVSRVLRPGGLLHCATDWADYASWMMAHLDDAALLANTAGSGCFAEQPAWRAHTRFERRGQQLGHDVFDLLYERVASDVSLTGWLTG